MIALLKSNDDEYETSATYYRIGLDVAAIATSERLPQMDLLSFEM